ncbi:hypothetical protein L3X38_031530 [Prunus dulcis]|uniref:Uncharacterized protein n=1 Tax=Prunus dulcis TaxID=3755 RepID=A0AAD4VCQ4_PRUDU|nr:hypothetical protein L3X38_031530 [Prunus dulcis]
MGVDDFFNPHGDADFDPEPDPDPDPDFEDDHDPDSEDDPDPEFVSDSDPDPDFHSDSGLDSGSDSDPNSYSTCILCIFRCTDYDFSTNDPDTWTIFPFVKSEDQLADILTKAISSKAFHNSLDQLGIGDIYAPT